MAVNDERSKLLSSCNRYLLQKDRVVNYMDFKVQIRRQLNLIAKLEKSISKDEDEIKYNKVKLGYIYYKYKFTTQNLKTNINESCKHILNFDEILSLLNRSQEKTQFGGSHTMADDIISMADDAVKNTHDYVVESKKVASILDNFDDVDKCLNNTYFDDDGDQKFPSYDSLYKFNCFKTLIGSNPETEKKMFIYFKFKKVFNQEFTDLFVRNYLNSSTERFIMFCNFVYFTLDYALRTLVVRYNVQNKTKIDFHDVHILYKGGNTTRMLIGHLFKKIHLSCSSAKTKQAQQKMDDFIEKSLLGDFDLNVSIDFIKLKKKLGDDISKVNEFEKIIGAGELRNLRLK